MCINQKQSTQPQAAAPAAPRPITLEQLAPKSASEGESNRKRKKSGLSRYKIQTANTPVKSNKLGGIPTKTGTGR